MVITIMSDPSRHYENFLELRKQSYNFIWTSRKLNPQLAYHHGIPRPTPISHKESVLNSPRIQELLENISKKENVPKLVLEEKVKTILDEIGYKKNLKVIRWLALVLVKICLRISTGIYVNVDYVVKLKADMGNCPVIFVPSHRSYADFILMSYFCFTYDVEIPAIAAGMDFHGMRGIGNMLRDTGAFFMRRSYNDDGLYWATFKQYIYQLVVNGDLPIEFFIEGTRSRTNKSLVPKYGLISMILKAFFFAEVPDIKFVPINISYDRILEETLFAFELLGVPKPKESTSGFFKSLTVLKENFGNIYLHFAEPISAKKFFGDKLDRSVHSISPLHVQEITEKEKALIPSLAHEIVHTQQKCGIITVFNLVSLVLNDNLVTSKELLTIEELSGEVHWIKDVIQTLGAFVHTEDVEKSINECFLVHENLIKRQLDDRICLVQNNIVLDKINSSKFKAHSLSEKCMTFSVPFVMLQIYINPSLHYFIDVGLIVIILRYHRDLNAEDLFNEYYFLRSLLSVEFVTTLPWVKTEFENALQHSATLGLIQHTSINSYVLGNNRKMQNFLHTLFEPFMMAYYVTVAVLEISPVISDEKTILINSQKILEDKVNDENEFVHPYSLNLDTLTNCLNVLVTLEALHRSRSGSTIKYEIRRQEIVSIKQKLGNYMPNRGSEEIFIKQIYIKHKL